MLYHLFVGVTGTLLLLSLWLALARLGAREAQGSGEATAGMCEAESLGCGGCAPGRPCRETGRGG